MLDCITELIFDDDSAYLVGVPDMEDFILTQIGLNVSIRNSRVRSFTAWYVGDELTNPEREKGVPSLARTIFSELWERRVILEDPTVLTQLEKQYGSAFVHGSSDKVSKKKGHSHGHKHKHKHKHDDNSSSIGDSSGVSGSTALVVGGPLPTLIEDDNIGESGTVTPTPIDMTGDGHAIADTTDTTDGDNDGEEDGEIAVIPVLTEDTIRQAALYDPNTIVAFEKALATGTGSEVRVAMLSRYISVIGSCRQFSMSKALWPPGPQKSSSR